MLKLLKIFSLLLALSFLFLSLTAYDAFQAFEVNPTFEEQQESRSNNVTPEIGGSNYAFISLGKYADDPNEENWFSDVKTPAVHYHQHQAQVKEHLDFMIANGQKKIAIPIWFGGPNANCITHAHTLCPQDGKLPEIGKQNIQNILTEIKNRNFSEIHIRLATQGTADVNHWESFSESIYESNRSFIFDVIDASEEVLKDSSIQVYYDLGLELMGHPFVVRKPWVKEYLKRLWAAYLQNYDVKKTVGFSFNHAHRDATFESLKIFDDSGVRPPRLAFDIYVDRPKHLRNISLNLQARGWGKQYPIYIQETYRGSANVARDVIDARTKLGLNIRSIMQWPLDENAKGHSNSTDYRFDTYR